MNNKISKNLFYQGNATRIILKSLDNFQMRESSDDIIFEQVSL